MPGAQSQDYTEQVGDVLALLAGTYRSTDGEEAHVVPGEGAALQVWILGSSGGESAEVAGENGVRFAANYHVSPATVLEAADGYRAAFRSSAELEQPYVSVSAHVVVADDEATARELATGYGSWVRSIRTAEGAIQFPTPDEARRHVWSDADRALVADRVDTQFVGTGRRPARTTARRHQRRRGDHHDDHPRPRRPRAFLSAAGRGVGSPMTVAIVVGNPKPKSRTFHAAEVVAEKLTGRAPTSQSI